MPVQMCECAHRNRKNGRIHNGNSVTGTVNNTATTLTEGKQGVDCQCMSKNKKRHYQFITATLPNC